ncbi:hypothetical protein FISHEDRAFT_57632 [Fistulina hepatica ATCC 64428]|uniref:J domain-containing protein n=1 Tax=Fistulina hepatica ATCC 64428 TaxID=1128425 RepID=A0A0D7AHK4_9AGAR|nr:hypothetical protein FISHEDRAFT_57632 [Fistulina hepatica ATCC 64428]
MSAWQREPDMRDRGQVFVEYLYMDVAGHIAKGGFAWARAQERDDKLQATAQWILDHQMRQVRPEDVDTREEVRRAYDGWKAQQEAQRRYWEERKREQEQEQQRRQAEYASRLAEWQRLQRQQQADQRRQQEIHKRRRVRERQAAAEAWQLYESRWSALDKSQEALTFAAVPWPVVSPPTSPASLTPGAISHFLFSGMGADESRKERVKQSLLRWHPDRFARISRRVDPSHREAVEEGVGIVARQAFFLSFVDATVFINNYRIRRCLNSLMES